ncbi:hypothetical protein [Paenibacillus sp. UASWS1643]|uniref:hypothetical protein n=1 Tax=Paenibacillus sp. UASWS1643 TaxID=2580422 RepID=UPI00295C0FC9|nr:hypothetical protein [Paenibacillus sp. UASWS1643]
MSLSNRYTCTATDRAPVRLRRRPQSSVSTSCAIISDQSSATGKRLIDRRIFSM